MPSSSPLLPLHLFSLEGHQYLGTEEKPGEDADRIESLHDVGNRPDAKGSQVSCHFHFLLLMKSLLSFSLRFIQKTISE